MSGGQQQRLSLALALIGKPNLVFLDEPTAGMDPHARATTWTMIRELRDHGTTVVLTTHAMDEAEHLCDRVGIIDHGRLVALDTPKELTTHAASDETTFTTVSGLAVDELAARLGLAAGHGARATARRLPRRRRPRRPRSLAAITAWLAEQRRAAERAARGSALAGRRVPPPHRRGPRVKAARCSRRDPRADPHRDAAHRCGAARACSSRW